MAASSEDWSVNANDAVQVSLVQYDPEKSSLQNLHSFHPKFTYPIFGQEEQIFGYKGLEIGIQFSAHNCRPNVLISYNKKFPQVGATTALDIVKTLKDFLPEDAFEQDYEEKLKNDQSAKDWTPPGNHIHTYTRKGRIFEVWAGSLLDPKIRELLDNIQIYVLFFIEAGSFLNLDDPDWSLDRWHIYFIFEKTSIATASNVSPYVLAGYATTYRFYRFIPPSSQPIKTDLLATFPNLEKITPRHLSCRLRISQFLVLPPFQSAGHGSELYQMIYKDAMADATVTELTVEDPSEEFDKLRDINDWKVLEPAFRTANIRIDSTAVAGQASFKKVPNMRLLPVDRLKEIRLSKKIAPRQFARQVELYLLSLIPHSHRNAGGASLVKLLVKKHKSSDPDDRTYYWWRILLKQRIFKKNKDVLSVLDPDEKRTHIEDSARGQEDEYEGLLLYLAMAKAKEEGLNGNGSTSSGGPSSSSVRKRKVIVEDEDDEDDAASTASKRARA